MRLLALVAAAAALTTAAIFAAPAQSAPTSPRSYAHALTIALWHSEAQWQALDEIVTPESGWNPCSVYPSVHNCRYSGSNSCGIPQASPCPAAWRGRLDATWRQQVRWLIAYVWKRYGSPLGALAFRTSHGWY